MVLRPKEIVKRNEDLYSKSCANHPFQHPIEANVSRQSLTQVVKSSYFCFRMKMCRGDGDEV